MPHSDLEDLALLLNLAERVQLPPSAAGTNPAGLSPGFRCFQIRFPEGPSPALARSGGIDGALAIFAIQEHAVAIGQLFEALSGTNPAHIGVLKRFYAHAQQRCQGDDFFVGDPNMARRTRAAVATLGASKSQPIAIPRKIVGHAPDRSV